MGRLVAFVANDSDRAACALYPARKQLVASPEEAGATAFDSWGIGFYQGGEVLLQRRPKPSTEPVDFYASARELRTDAIIGHARIGTVGKPKNENTHPFRFRSWLFAHHGTLPTFDTIAPQLLGNIPDFLRRNIRGQTDSEHLFHLVLAFLHDAGKLDDPNVSPSVVCEAVRASVALVDRLAESEGAARWECALALTNGRILVASRRGHPVYVQRTQAIVDCPVCRETTPQYGREPRRIDHEHLRSVLVVADTPAVSGTWHEVDDDTLIAVGNDLGVTYSPLRG